MATRLTSIENTLMEKYVVGVVTARYEVQEFFIEASGIGGKPPVIYLTLKDDDIGYVSPIGVFSTNPLEDSLTKLLTMVADARAAVFAAQCS